MWLSLVGSKLQVGMNLGSCELLVTSRPLGTDGHRSHCLAAWTVTGHGLRGSCALCGLASRPLGSIKAWFLLWHETEWSGHCPFAFWVSHRCPQKGPIEGPSSGKRPGAEGGEAGGVKPQADVGRGRKGPPCDLRWSTDFWPPFFSVTESASFCGHGAGVCVNAWGW